jgi:hypothetical protein
MSTHEDLAVARLPEHMKGDDKLEALVRVLAAPMDGLQAECTLVSEAYRIETALGVQLDAIGAWVGLAREGRPDEDYRLWLQAQLLVLRTAGRAQDLETILTLVAGAAELELLDFVGYVQFSAAPLVRAEQVYAILHRAKAAGVRIGLVYSEYEDLILFGTPAEYTYDATVGIGDTGSVGGRLAAVLA